mmetsp:Transcript_40785/g.121730  ORF Transcript_40785/g.121730 Transcript_40785/m.121730 type:complete len:364 (+) Transcript_40785:2573-3664(+)
MMKYHTPGRLTFTRSTLSVSVPTGRIVSGGLAGATAACPSDLASPRSLTDLCSEMEIVSRTKFDSLWWNVRAPAGPAATGSLGASPVPPEAVDSGPDSVRAAPSGSRALSVPSLKLSLPAAACTPPDVDWRGDRPLAASDLAGTGIVRSYLMASRCDSDWKLGNSSVSPTLTSLSRSCSQASMPSRTEQLPVHMDENSRSSSASARTCSDSSTPRKPPDVLISCGAPGGAPPCVPLLPAAPWSRSAATVRDAVCAASSAAASSVESSVLARASCTQRSTSLRGLPSMSSAGGAGVLRRRKFLSVPGAAYKAARDGLPGAEAVAASSRCRPPLDLPDTASSLASALPRESGGSSSSGMLYICAR